LSLRTNTKNASSNALLGKIVVARAHSALHTKPVLVRFIDDFISAETRRTPHWRLFSTRWWENERQRGKRGGSCWRI